MSDTTFIEKFKGFELKKQLRIAALLLFAISFLQFAYTIGNPLLWDSATDILYDKTIRSPSSIPDYFTQKTVLVDEYGQKVAKLEYYRPVAKTINVIEYAFFGQHAAGYHFISVLLNSFVVVAFFFLLMSFTSNLRLSFAAALLFAVNPAGADAVFWVYARTHLLSALFCILSLLYFRKHRIPHSLIFFLLALLSRESSILFPIVLVLHEAIISSNKSFKKYLNLWPYFLLAIIYFFMRLQIIGELPPLSDLSLAEWFNTVAVIIKRYLKIMIFPDAAIIRYPLVIFKDINSEVIISYIVLIISIIIAALLWKKDKPVLFWYLWFFLWIAIWFNVGKFGEFLIAEKGIYLASAGMSAVIARQILRSPFAKHILIILCSIYFITTFIRGTYWRSDKVFFGQLVESSPGMPTLRFHLGMAYVNDKDYQNAIKHLKIAVEEEPVYSKSLNNLGNCYYVLGNNELAAEMWTRAIAADSSNLNVLYNLGMASERNGNIKAALEYYEKFASKVRPVPENVLARIRQIENKIDSLRQSGE